MKTAIKKIKDEHKKVIDKSERDIESLKKTIEHLKECLTKTKTPSPTTSKTKAEKPVIATPITPITPITALARDCLARQASRARVPTPIPPFSLLRQPVRHHIRFAPIDEAYYDPYSPSYR